MDQYINFNHHKRVLGILFLVFSIINILLVVGIFTIAATVLPFIDLPHEDVLVIELIKYSVLTYVVLFSVPSIIVGLGLINQKDWALTGALVIGILALPIFPIWTFVGVYAIIIFFLYQGEKSRIEVKSSQSKG